MLKPSRGLVLLLLAFFCAGISSFDALFAPRKDLWMFWADSNDYSKVAIDHGVWDQLLKTYVVAGATGPNRFAYAKVSTADRQNLETYLKILSSVPIRRYSEAEQRVYWINYYNALTVQVILAHYPVASIQDIDISPGLFGRGPWGKKLVTVEGQELSLNDIEHRILRPIWDDPRLHYALNCAAIGCPDLRATAFTKENAEALLEDSARRYVNSSRGVWKTEDGLAVSSIYAWFAEDFGGDDKGIIKHLLQYAEPGLRDLLEPAEEIAEHDYDWRLNDAL